MHDYASLAVRQPAETVLSLVQSEAHAALSDPAWAILTDLQTAPSVVVPAAEPLRESLRLMQLAGVRMAFVVNATGGVIGMVTAADLQGERPMLAARSRMVSHPDLCVADVMTLVRDWPSVEVERLPKARVGDIVATFQATGQRYLIVTERVPATADRPGPASSIAVRGVFSASRAERALGHPIDQHLRSRSFSELAAALAHE